MFHAKNGLFFKRNWDNSVTVIKTNDGKQPSETNVVCNGTLKENEWASAVCSVSAEGETAERWNQSRQFHGILTPTEACLRPGGT